MIAFDVGDTRFSFRVAGVCIQDRHVLLHRAEGQDFWSLPGGHVDAGEHARVALAREWMEELGVSVQIGRFHWLVENLFEHSGQKCHELGFYFEVSLPSDSPALDVSRRFTHLSDGGYNLVFQWFPLVQVGQTPLYPVFLRTALLDLPAHLTHIVQTDDRWERPSEANTGSPFPSSEAGGRPKGRGGWSGG